MKKALRGWTKKTNVKLVTKSIVDFQSVETTDNAVLDINKQPMPPTQIDKKPEGQRFWVWWSFIVKDGPLLKQDDIVIIDNVHYRIQKRNDWTESGFQKYEATEDYIEPST